MKNADKQTDNWIKANGLNVKIFNNANVELLMAQKIAHTLLKEHGKLLGQNQAATLNNFNKAMSNGKLRRQLTPNQCYKVMNIGKEVNRKLFKAYKSR